MYRTGEGGSDCCYNTQYSDGKSCRPCIDGANCSIVGTNIATQVLELGYWRDSTNTTDIRKCWLQAACNNTAIVTAVNTSSNATMLSTATSTTTGTSSSSAAILNSVLSGSNPYCAPGYKGPCTCTHCCNYLKYTVYDVQCELCDVYESYCGY
jgi:hypothetical protein